MKVVAKKIRGDCDYVTEDKVYEAFGVHKYGFEIIDDEGDTIGARFRSSCHINGDWTIIGNPAVVVKQ